MQSLHEVMCNAVAYDLTDSKKAAAQLENCYDSKGMQNVLNGSTFKYHLWGSTFHMLPQSYIFLTDFV